MTSAKSLKEWCRSAELNRGPTDYESVALPLSYFGVRGALPGFGTIAQSRGFASLSASVSGSGGAVRGGPWRFGVAVVSIRMDMPASEPFSPARRTWPLIARWSARDAAVAAWAEHRGGVVLFAYEFVRFGVKQGWACLFGGLLLAVIVATRLWNPETVGIARYDFLFLAALAIQIVLLATRLETLAEARVILLFHAVAMGMEIFKIAVGSWAYPDSGHLCVLNVPLFAGFMYAAVGSYIARAWRLFDFRFTRHPPFRAMALLSAGIYANFFTHHFIVDLRWLLFVATAAAFGPATVHFRIWKAHRRMPLIVGFLLVALFIWGAENIGTVTHAWLYPFQTAAWRMVRFTKLGSWFLLMIVSYTLVSLVERPRAFEQSRSDNAERIGDDVP